MVVGMYRLFIRFAPFALARQQDYLTLMVFMSKSATFRWDIS